MKLDTIYIAITIISSFHFKVHVDGSETFACGRNLVTREALTVNGYKSEQVDSPWHANILHVAINLNIQYKCDGTLLNSDSILTAAHCVYENSKPIIPDRILIQLGKNDSNVSGVNSEEIEDHQTFPHHSFNAFSLANDIAIIRLATKATFNNHVQPICLSHPNSSSFDGIFGSVVGLGDDRYVVFTDVEKYLDWIRDILAGLPSTEAYTLRSTTVPGTETTTLGSSSNRIDYCYFLNNDLTNARIGRDDCEERCTSTPNCTHFTWTYFNDGTCWMKQNKVSAIDAHRSDDKSAVCGMVENSAYIEWTDDWAFACDFWENDLANVKTSGDECNNRCASTEGCTHFTWTNYNGGTCWMKQNSVGKKDAFVSKDKSSVCGIAKNVDWNGNNWAVGCDFRGNDIQNVRSRNDECGPKCASHPTCTHFTYNGAFGGTCWMKQYNGVTKSDAVVTLDTSFVCGVI